MSDNQIKRPKVNPIRDLDKFILMQKLMMDDGLVRQCLLLKFMFYTNLRVIDALHVKWSDLVNKETNQIVFNLEVIERKTSKNKWIPLPSALRTTLANYYSKYSPKLTSYVFRSYSNRIQGRNQPWTRQYATEIFKLYAKKAGIKENIASHSARKTWGYHAYAAGIDIYEISRMLGHRNIRDTEIYCGIDADRIREQYELVASLNKKAEHLFGKGALPDNQKGVRLSRKKRK